MKIAIIRYNAGNTASVANAFRRLGVEPVITADADAIRSADRVVFPGVGEASTAMANLRENGLDRLIPTLTQPVLGICLGMQLLCRSSEENDTSCLNVFDTPVERFPERELKVPHMGWNRITGLRSGLFHGIDEGSHAYFVHSYRVAAFPQTTAECTYGDDFSAAAESGNFYAVQFHPERSGSVGSRLLENFLNL